MGGMYVIVMESREEERGLSWPDAEDVSKFGFATVTAKGKDGRMVTSMNAEVSKLISVWLHHLQDFWCVQSSNFRYEMSILRKFPSV
jgi:hypothetical protein